MLYNPGDLIIPAITIEFSLILMLIGMVLAVVIDSYIDSGERRIFWIVILLEATLVVQNLAGYVADTDGTMPYARTIIGIYGYCVRPTILAIFCYIVDLKRKHRIIWVLIAINAAVHLTALVSDICFTIDENNHFHRGPLGYTCHIISGIMLIYLLWLTFRKYEGEIRKDAIIPIVNAIVIIVSVILDSTVDYREFPATFLTVAVVVSSVFYYIWLHLQFVHEHEDDLMARQRIQIMMTQIQPHFLYNTIATFKALCRNNPERAAEVAENFGSYLRQNMDYLDVSGCIPFSKELEHTRIYADIEMVRFENIKVTYDIGDEDFSIPPLTIQPIVENAIRHGVRIRDEGIVRVITRRKEDSHEIVIEDNGKGFYLQEIGMSEGQHIGIGNVRERVEKMCRGTLEIDSRIGEGTRVTIRIPIRGGSMNEGDMCR